MFVVLVGELPYWFLVGLSTHVYVLVRAPMRSEGPEKRVTARPKCSCGGRGDGLVANRVWAGS